MKTIQITENGGAEVLGFEEVNTPQPSEGEVLVKVAAVGVNFIDIYRREGIYPVSLPHIPGSEAAGVVEAVGEGVSEVQVGAARGGRGF